MKLERRGLLKAQTEFRELLFRKIGIRFVEKSLRDDQNPRQKFFVRRYVGNAG